MSAPPLGQGGGLSERKHISIENSQTGLSVVVQPAPHNEIVAGAPRTFSEFEKFRQALFEPKFSTDSNDPFVFGLQRNEFELKRLEKLIEAAQGVEGITIRSRLKGWNRQLLTLREARQRFLLLNNERQEERKRSFPALRQI